MGLLYSFSRFPPELPHEVFFRSWSISETKVFAFTQCYVESRLSMELSGISLDSVGQLLDCKQEELLRSPRDGIESVIESSAKRFFLFLKHHREVQGAGIALVACVFTSDQVYISSVGSAFCYLLRHSTDMDVYRKSTLVTSFPGGNRAFLGKMPQTGDVKAPTILLRLSIPMRPVVWLAI